MKDKLKIKIWNYKNVVLYEVLEQSDNLRGKGLLFTASNDLKVMSYDYPDINSIEMYIKGTEKGTDKIVANLAFDSTKEAKQFVEKVKQAVKEFNEALSSILTDEEKEYLRGVIKPFRSEVEWIAKRNEGFIEDGWCTYHIFIAMKKSRNCIPLPYFKGNAMYKNMELGKHYTLEELGL